MIFGGCNTGNSDLSASTGLNPIAMQFTLETDVTSIGADGFTSPVLDAKGKETGSIKADNGFYKFQKEPDGSVSKTLIGKEIDPTILLTKAENTQSKNDQNNAKRNSSKTTGGHAISD